MAVVAAAAAAQSERPRRFVHAGRSVPSGSSLDEAADGVRTERLHAGTESPVAIQRATGSAPLWPASCERARSFVAWHAHIVGRGHG